MTPTRAVLREGTAAGNAMQTIGELAAPMRAEEERLFAMRTDQCRPQRRNSPPR